MENAPSQKVSILMALLTQFTSYRITIQKETNRAKKVYHISIT